MASFKVWTLDLSLLHSQFLFTYCHVPPLPWEDLFHTTAQDVFFVAHVSSRLRYDNLTACLHYIIHLILKFFLEYFKSVYHGYIFLIAVLTDYLHMFFISIAFISRILKCFNFVLVLYVILTHILAL